jgi:hypothetical protein
MAVTPAAAFPVVINAAPDSGGAAGTYQIVGGVTKGSYAPKEDLVDKTYFGSNGARDKFPTIRDGQIQLSGQFPLPAGAVTSSDPGQAVLMSAQGLADQYVWIKIYWDGTTHGPVVRGLVADFKVDFNVAGALEWSATIDFSGSLPVYN